MERLGEIFVTPFVDWFPARVFNLSFDRVCGLAVDARNVFILSSRVFGCLTTAHRLAFLTAAGCMFYGAGTVLV